MACRCEARQHADQHAGTENDLQPRGIHNRIRLLTPRCLDKVDKTRFGVFLRCSGETSHSKPLLNALSIDPGRLMTSDGSHGVRVSRAEYCGERATAAGSSLAEIFTRRLNRCAGLVICCQWYPTRRWKECKRSNTRQPNRPGGLVSPSTLSGTATRAGLQRQCARTNSRCASYPTPSVASQ